jgi:drug/metabolite transporter (DMT)-like permease
MARRLFHTRAEIVSVEVAPNRRLVIASFLAVYLIWGSTYLGIRFAIETIPPFTLSAARFGLAGLIMLVAAIVMRAPKPTAPQIRTAAIVGCLLMLANSLVGVAEKRIPSGVAALIVGLTPVFMVLLEWARPGGRRPTVIVAIGLTIGLIGVATLVGPSSFGDGQRIDLIGAGIVAFGSLCWSSGAIYSRHAPKPQSGVMNSAIQMLVGGVFVAILGVWRGELATFSIGQISARSAIAWTYLLIFGSLIGFTAFVYLLRVSTPARVATYAYVNPVVAVILGWLVGHETISPRMLVAAAIIVGGVAIITAGEGRGPGVTKAYPVPKPRDGVPIGGARASDRA